MLKRRKLQLLFFILLPWPVFAVPSFSQDSLLAQSDQNIVSENYLQAIDQYLKVINTYEQTDSDPEKLAYAYMKLGICYDYFDYLEFSGTYFNKALTLYRKTHNLQGQAYCLSYLGDMEEDEGRNGAALKYQLLALQYFKQLDDQAGLAVVYDNMASIYENMPKYDSSLICLQKALAIYQTLKDSVGVSVVLNNFGDIYRKLGNKKKALTLYKSSLATARQINNKEEERGNLKDLAKIYAELHDYKKAYVHFDQFFDSHRKLKIEKKLSEIAAIQIQSIHEKKNLQIKAIEADKKILSLRFTIAVIALIMGVLVLIAIYVAYRIKTKKDRQLTKLQNEKMEIELEARRQKLIDYTKMLTERGEMIDQLKEKLHDTMLKEISDDKLKFKAIQQLTQASILTDDDWVQFKKQFESVYEGFFPKLQQQYHDLSAGDMRLAALMKLQLNREEIAHMMGISADSVKKAKNRLKKKISDEEFKLKEWIEAL